MILLVIDIHHHTTLQKLEHWEELHYGPLNSATTVWLSHLRLYHPILWIVWIFVQHLLIEMEAVVMICERPNSFISQLLPFASPDTHSFFTFGYWLGCPFRYSIPVTPDPFLYSIDALKQLDCLNETMVTINKIVRVSCYILVNFLVPMTYSCCLR